MHRRFVRAPLAEPFFLNELGFHSSAHASSLSAFLHSLLLSPLSVSSLSLVSSRLTTLLFLTKCLLLVKSFLRTK